MVRFLPAFFAHWGTDDLGCLLELEELVAVGVLFLLGLLLTDRSRRECHQLDLTHDVGLFVGDGHWRGHLAAWAANLLLQFAR